MKPETKAIRERLRKASDHLWYEIWMFQSLALGISSGIAGKSIINNALIEAFAIHVRVLIHFFYADNQEKKDDVVAQNFFSSPDIWLNARPQKTDMLKRAQTRANKEIAHLTYTRQKVLAEEKHWDIDPIYRDLNVVIDTFIKMVPKYLLGSRWVNYKKGQINEETT